MSRPGQASRCNMFAMSRTGIMVFVLASFLGACTSGSGGAKVAADGGDDGGLSCQLGGACSQTQVCSGGIAGCTANCQCLSRTWQAPCPTTLPPTGSACAPANAECGYTTSSNACGAANCYCQGGAWNCEPTCIVVDASVPDGTDGPVEGDGQALECTDTTRLVQASSYDRKCQTDSDCVGVGEGYACECETIFCVTAAINSGAYAQWKSDVGYNQYLFDLTNAPLADRAGCGCPTGIACCSSGTCQWGYPLCPYPGAVLVVDARDAGGDAGSAFDAGAE